MEKMVKCKACGKDIAKSANVCPHCGAKQHKGVGIACGIVIVIAFLLILAVIIAGGGNESDTNTQTENQGSQATAQPSEDTKTDKLIYNDSGLKIYFLGFEKAPQPAIGYYINLRIENTSDIDRTIQVRDVSADGIMVPFEDAIFSGSVLSGKTLNSYVWITNTEQIGIKEMISSVELKFAIYDSNDLGSEFTTDTIKIE